MERKKYIKNLVFASLVAALYAGLTYISGFFGLAYGNIQFRLSEILTVLAVFSPSSVLGLTAGCFLGNIASFNPIDMIFGTAATLLAAIVSYLLRNVKFFKIPLLSFLSPVIINSVIVGLELSVFFAKKPSSFFVFALWVALGETVVCLIAGIPFYKILSKHKNIFDF